MLRQFKRQWREFQSVAPGKRFKGAYDRRQLSGRNSLGRRLMGIAAALGAFVLGVVFSLIPGIPGFVFFFLGAILLAAESFYSARFLDWFDLKLRAFWARFRRSRRKTIRIGSP